MIGGRAVLVRTLDLVSRTGNSCINLGWTWIGWGMQTGCLVAKIELSSEVAGMLKGYTQRRKTAQALALWALIVWAARRA